MASGSARAQKARALLFVVVSAVAVPACQLYDGADKPQGSQALRHEPPPPTVVAFAAPRST
jgi:hypothetical protein